MADTSDAAEWIRAITFDLATASRVVPPHEVKAAIAALRNEALTEAADLIVAQQSARWADEFNRHGFVDRETELQTEAVARDAQTLLAARTAAHSCGNCDGIDPASCLFNRTATAQEQTR